MHSKGFSTTLKLIGSTVTRAGLKIEAQLDENKYPTGKKVSDDEMEALSIEPADFHGEWNYLISPRK